MSDFLSEFRKIEKKMKKRLNSKITYEKGDKLVNFDLTCELETPDTLKVEFYSSTLAIKRMNGISATRKFVQQ